jgi:G6PDH family F420-dependent oxidoreductase
LRIHPAIIAQAAATSAAMLPGRFFLGLGTGENLNEHILGDKWPASHTRRAMLEEAVDIIRELWTGEEISYEGAYYTVENARLYTLPETLPPLMIAAGGPKSAEVAAKLGDGLIGTSPDAKMLAKFDEAGGRDKPKIAELGVCWATDERSARRTAHEWWPTAAMESSLAWELPLPKHFQDVATLVTEDAVAETIVCGPDVDRHLEAITKYADAGYGQVCIHQIGPDQQGFLKFYEREVLPRLGKLRTAA